MAMHPFTKARTFLILTMLVSVTIHVLQQAKFLVLPFIWLATYLHEIFHGFMAMVFHAQFRDLRIFTDGTGIALYKGPLGTLPQSLIAAAGLMAPIVWAAFLFALTKKAQWARVGLVLLALFLIASSILVVQNPFGWIVGLGFATVLFLLSRLGNPLEVELYTAFIASQLVLSLISRYDDLFGEHSYHGTSDTVVMAEALLLPSWFWGLFVSGLGALVLILGLRQFFKSHTPIPIKPPVPVAAPTAKAA